MLRKRMASLQSENDKIRQGLTSGSSSTQGLAVTGRNEYIDGDVPGVAS